MALRAKKYFQDYDVEVKLVNGKEHRSYVYKGDLYARELTEQARTGGETVENVIADVLHTVPRPRPEKPTHGR